MDTKCSGFIRVESSTCRGINKSNRDDIERIVVRPSESHIHDHLICMMIQKSTMIIICCSKESADIPSMELMGCKSNTQNNNKNKLKNPESRLLLAFYTFASRHLFFLAAGGNRDSLPHPNLSLNLLLRYGW